MRWPWQKEESDLDRELRYHLETLADEFEKQGMSRADAMKRARREFGGVESVRDQCRDESRWNWLLSTWQDIRFGWRMMKKTPAVTLAAIGTLALGIGATTAVLSLANSMLWKPMGVPNPEQMVEVQWSSKDRPEGIFQATSGGMYLGNGLSVADFFSMDGYRAMRNSAASKAVVAAHISDREASIVYQGMVAVAHIRGVTENFFQMLQLQPFAGRLLAEGDEKDQNGLVVVVTHRFWENQLNKDPDVVGRSMTINNFPYTIAGILPQRFTGIAVGDGTDLYTTIEQSPAYLSPEGWYKEARTQPLSWWLQIMARKRPGVTNEELYAVLQPAFASSWAAQPKTPEQAPHIRLSDAVQGLGEIRREWGNPVWMLLGLVSTVLVISCANIANLLLARAVEREKEAALRVSLGCSTGRLMRQFFTESLLLAMLGGSLSIVVAISLGRLIESLLPSGLTGMRLDLSLDPYSLVAAGAVTLFTALLFGLYPAWKATRINVTPALKEGSGSAGTMSHSRLNPAKMLVLLQVSLGVLLVTAAVLFTGRLNEMTTRETGFERKHSILFDIRPGETGYDAERLSRFYIDVEDRLKAVPGVASVGLSRTRPMKGGGYWDDVRLAGQEKRVPSAIHHVNAEFLNALGVPLLMGRGLTVQESHTGSKLAVVDETIAKTLGGNNPLGMQIQVGDDQYEVVGVVRKARYAEMEESPAVAYIPFGYQRMSATVLLRTSLPPMAIFPAIRNAMQEIDHDLPLVDVFTMEEQISRTLQRERLFAWLCGSFGVLALVLCVVGLYGLMSHSTARRTSEIGIRMALGASQATVLNQVLREGLVLAFAGLVIGAPMALYAAHLASQQRIIPNGPVPYWTLAVAIGVIALSALMAVLAPAVRASSVDPMQALRRG